MHRVILFLALIMSYGSFGQNEIRIRIMNNDRPLANKKVDICLVKNPSVCITSKTDANGRLTVKLTVSPPQLFVVRVHGYADTKRALKRNDENIVTVRKTKDRINWEARYRETKRRAEKAEAYGQELQREIVNLKKRYESRIAQLQSAQSAELQRLRNRIRELELFGSEVSTEFENVSNKLSIVEESLEKKEVENKYINDDLENAYSEVNKYKNRLFEKSDKLYEIEAKLKYLQKIAYMDILDCQCVGTDGKNYIKIQFTLVDSSKNVITSDETVTISYYRKRNMRERFEHLKSITVNVPGGSYNYPVTLSSPNNFTFQTNLVLNNFKVKIKHKNFPKSMVSFEILDIRKDCKIRS